VRLRQECQAWPCAAAAGKGKEHRALTAPEPTQRITYHAQSAPLHKIKTDNMLPTQLLTPFQVCRNP
jgi:protein arginine N-methyltransferase 7